MCSPQSVIDEIGRESRCGSERRQETGPVGRGETCHWAGWGELDRRGLGMRAGHRAPGRLCWVASRGGESTHWVRKLASARQEHVSDAAWVASLPATKKSGEKKKENQDRVSTLKTACAHMCGLHSFFR